METTHPASFFRSQEPFIHKPAGDIQDRFGLEEDRQRVFVCRTCGHAITRLQDRIAKNGMHAHALFNPAGILFEVGCFATAMGCRFEGAFTTEFTWFPGYAWRFAMCRQCSVHLGWEYRGTVDGFVGLIMTELREL